MKQKNFDPGKIIVAINQKYIRVLTCLLKDITRALQNYTTALKKIEKED